MHSPEAARKRKPRFRRASLLLRTGARPGSFLASRAQREQGIFDGEGANIPVVCERLTGKNNAAIAGAAARKRKPRGGGVFRAGLAKLSFRRRERSSCKAGFGEMARSIRFVCERLEPNPNAADASAAAKKKPRFREAFLLLRTGARPGSFLASRATREQGIFDGEGASIHFV